MMGEAEPVDLPSNLIKLLDQVHDAARAKLNSILLEWAFEGKDIWIIQLQQEAALSTGSVIVPGAWIDEVTFDPREVSMQVTAHSQS
jgi:hypothetical protein